MKVRTIASILALALLLVPISALGADGEDGGEQYRIGTKGAIYVALGEMDSNALTVNGYPYRPSTSIINRIIINAGDLVTALKLDAAKDELQKQGIDVSDLYIRSGKIFMSDENSSDVADAKRTQQLADARALLDATDVSAFDLSGKIFALSSGDTLKTFTIASVWQSPLDPPGYDPFSVAAPLPPAPQQTAAPVG